MIIKYNAGVLGKPFKGIRTETVNDKDKINQYMRALSSSYQLLKNAKLTCVTTADNNLAINIQINAAEKEQLENFINSMRFFGIFDGYMQAIDSNTISFIITSINLDEMRKRTKFVHQEANEANIAATKVQEAALFYLKSSYPNDYYIKSIKIYDGKRNKSINMPCIHMRSSILVTEAELNGTFLGFLNNLSDNQKKNICKFYLEPIPGTGLYKIVLFVLSLEGLKQLKETFEQPAVINRFSFR